MDPLALLKPEDSSASVPRHPVRAFGIDLDATSSTVAEIVWQPSGPEPKVRCLEVDQETLSDRYTHLLVPSAVATHDGKMTVGECARAGMEVEVPKQRSGNNGLPTHDFNSSRPNLMAFHSAKGLTFDAVLMPRLVCGSFQCVTPARVLFVALTRAAKWAYFSTTLNDPLPLFQKLLPLEQTRQLIVRRGDQAGKLKALPGTVQHSPLDLL